MPDFNDGLPGPTSKPDKIPEPPGLCSCGKPSVVNLLAVTDGRGNVLKGSASTYCGRDNHGNPNWVLLDRYRIAYWECKCAECFTGQKQPTHPSPWSNDQARVAWLWLLGEMSAESETLPFKRRKLTDDQRDTALEIINSEAVRCGMEFVIPKEFRLEGEPA